MTDDRDRAMALAFLDLHARPLTVRQIEQALREHGVSKSQRATLASAIRHLAIIAVRGKGVDHD